MFTFVLVMKASFSNIEKLKSKVLIDALFANGSSMSCFPLQFVYLQKEFPENITVKCGVSVSKKKFKRAVDRNRMKRLMREAYRLNKNTYIDKIPSQQALMILYIGKDIPSSRQINQAMSALLQKFIKTAC